MRGVPAVGGFAADAGAEFEVGEDLDGVFEVASDEGAAPAEFGDGGDVGEGLDGALEEGGERGEAGLTVLVLRQVVVGLEELQPSAGLDLLAPARVEDVVVEGEEVAGSGVIGADVGAGGGNCGGSIGGGGACDHDRAGGFAGEEGWGDGLDRRRDGAEEVEVGARDADAAGVEQAGREDVLLLHAGDLLAQALIHQRKRILGGRICDGVVDGVDGEEEVVWGEVGVEAGGAEVLADVLRRAGEGLADAGGQAGGGEQLGTVLHGPEVEQAGDAAAERDGREDAAGVGHQPEARVVVGDEGDVGDAEVLAVALIVGEEEELVLADGAAEGGAEVVALELRDAGGIEVVAGVEEGVAQELIRGTVEVVGAAGGDDGDLCALALAVGCGVGVGDDVELADGLYAEELAGGSAGADIDERCAGVLDSVEQVEVVLRAAAGDGEHVADGRVGGADGAGALRGVVDRGGVQRDELVVAAAVEGKLLDLAGVDQAGGLLGGEVDDGRRILDGHVLRDAQGGEPDVHLLPLADGERDVDLAALTEAVRSGCDGVGADRDRRRGVAAIRAGLQTSLAAGLVVVDHDLGIGDHGAAWICDGAGDGASDHLGINPGRGEESEQKDEGGREARGLEDRAGHACLLMSGGARVRGRELRFGCRVGRGLRVLARGDNSLPERGSNWRERFA